MEEVTRDQLVDALNSLSEALLGNDQEEIRRRTLHVNALSAKASPEVVKSLTGTKITISEAVEAAGALVDAAKKAIEIFRRWRNL